MTIAALSLTQFPSDILGLISQHCDAKTLYAFRSTCKPANAIGKTEMSVETAARVVFHHPERYLDLKQNYLKESRAIVLNALTKLPKLFFDPGLPEHFRHDVEMIKTAFVASLVIEDVETKKRLLAEYLEAHLEKLAHDFSVMYDRHNPRGRINPIQESELFQLQPFVLLDSMSLCLTSQEIKKHLDVALELVRKDPNNFMSSSLDDSLLDNQELISTLLRLSEEAYAYRNASTRLRNNIALTLLAVSKNADNLNFLGPEIKNSALGLFLLWGPVRAIFNLKQVFHDTSRMSNMDDVRYL